MITNIEDYFSKGCGRCPRFETPECSTNVWLPGLAVLRRICRDSGLDESVKWGHPCYMFAGRNIAMLGAFRGDFRLTFFNASLIKDSEGLLEKAGPNSQNPSMIRFVTNAQVALQEIHLRAYLAEAMGLAAAGIRPMKHENALEFPVELLAALDNDSELAEAFHALTPGRQKSYVIALGSAKTSATRLAWVEKYRDKIIGGKGALDRE